MGRNEWVETKWVETKWGEMWVNEGKFFLPLEQKREKERKGREKNK